MIYEHKIDGFSGCIKIKMLKFKERLEHFKKLNVTQTKEGVEFNSESIEQFEKLESLAKSQIDSVDLKHSSGVEIKSIDELEYYEEYVQVINGIIGLLMNGAKLGN